MSNIGLIAADPSWFTPTFVVSTLGFMATIAMYAGNQRFTLWKERKQELLKLLTKIVMDAQDFKFAMIHALEAHKNVTASVPGVAPRTQDRVDFYSQQIKAAQREREAVFRVMNNASSLLRADCVALDLVTAKKSRPLTDAIKRLYQLDTQVSAYVTFSLIDFDTKVLTPRLEEIVTEMMPLWTNYADLKNYPEMADDSYGH